MEISTAEAAAQLGISQDRVGQLLRGGELVGRRLGPKHWAVDLASVQDRRQLSAAPGRPWSPRTAAAIIAALSDDTELDARSRDLLRSTSTDDLWRKISQLIEIRPYFARDPEAAASHLAPTGASASDLLGTHLLGRSRVLHGYVVGISLGDLLDEAGMAADPDGDIALHTASFLSASPAARNTPRALVAVDCCRDTDTRVRRVGLDALDTMKARWLARRT